MSLEILAGIFVLFSMAALGAPVAYAILSGIIVYLGVAGQDLAIACLLYTSNCKYNECRFNFRSVTQFLCGCGGKI